MVNKNKQQDADIMAELEMLRKLFWRLVAGLVIVFGAFFTLMGGGFVLLVNANAQQDIVIQEKPGYTLLAQYQEANEREHGIMIGVMTDMKSDIKDNNIKISNIDSNVAEIKGFLEGLKEFLNKKERDR